jgi:hypothetical protein
MKGLSISFNPRQSVVFGTVFLLIALGSAYYLWYIPRQQELLDRQQFRCLEHLENNIQEKADNTLQMLNAWMQNYENTSKKYGRNDLKTFLVAYQQQQHEFRLQFSLPIAGKPAKLQKRPALSDTLITVTNDHVIVRLQHQQALMEIDYTIAQFFHPLLQAGIFDQYVVYKQPAVIYQTYPNGISQAIADSLKDGKGTFTHGQVKTLVIGGTSYRLFVHQLALPGGTSLTVGGLAE